MMWTGSNGSAKLKTPDGTVVAAQNLMWKWWSRGVDLRRRVADWALHFFSEQNKGADYQLKRRPPCR